MTDIEREIVVSTFNLTDEEHEALFDRVAEAAHAKNEQVVCGTSLAPVINDD